VIEAGLTDPTREERTQIGARLGDSAVLLEGYRHAGVVAAGEVLPLALFWQTEAQLSHDYTVFVHLIDGQGNKLAQRDLPPLEGSLPTTGWRAGELLRDDQDLAVPPQVLPGTYELLVGMYRADTLEALGAPISVGTVEVR